MIFVLERTVEPEVEPVSLAEIREHLRMYGDITDEDSMLQGLVVAGRQWIEDYTGLALMDQTWQLTIDHEARPSDVLSGYVPRPGYYCGHMTWQLDRIALRRSPALAVTAFESLAEDGTATAIDASTYGLRDAASKWPQIVALSGATWQTSNRLRVTYRAGYGDTTGSPQDTATSIPQSLRTAVKLWVEAHYDRDKDVMDRLIRAAQSIANPYVVHMGFA